MKQLFYHGTIRTMEEPATAEAVLTEDARIAAIGSYEELRALAPDARQVDLHGMTMLPAFIDAHSHLSSYATSFLQVPLEECADFEEIEAQIRRFIEVNHVKSSEWVVAKGYDHNALREKRHPSLKLLDRAAPDNPLIVQHASGHVGVLNTLALKALKIDASTPSPEGGRIGVENGKLTGYMEENAFIGCLKRVPMNGMQEMLTAYRKALDGYASHGITTIQEGLTVEQMLPLYQLLIGQKLLTLDLVAYATPADAERFRETFPRAIGAYDEHFKLGGYKIILDGSPQGRTAWMRTPYQHQEPPYRGYGTMSDADVLSAVRLAATHRMQILAHCNGDAAAQQLINAVDAVERAMPDALVRPVMIHAQLLGTDQLSEVKRLGVIPSFFVAHVYHWGDAHIRNFGLERASQISPTRSALNEGIRFTFHQDTPVIEPNMLETVWCAVNRVTKAGVTLGARERIDVTEALKAVTINAAYQYGEESAKGSIAVGKRADFVVLDRDPLRVKPEEIREIAVMRTIKDGVVLYDASQSASDAGR